MIRFKSCFYVLALAILPLLGAHAQNAPGFEWLARTSEAEPNSGLIPGALLRPSGEGLRQIAVDKDFVKVSDLSDGRWVARQAMRHQMKNSRYPQLAQTQDPRSAYLWVFDRKLSVSQLGEQQEFVPLLQIEDPRLNRLMNSQGAGKLAGDAIHGFWVTNDYEGRALFIDPETWAVREVLRISPQPNNSAGINRAFEASALGSGGSLWVIEPSSRDVVRLDPLGKELARARWPFDSDANGPRMAGITRYGDGTLQMSAAGVLVISATRLDIALISETGQLRWKRSVCPSGVTARCAGEAAERAELSLIQSAVADETGRAWINDRTGALFFYTGTGDPVRRFGNVAPCTMPNTAGLAVHKPSPPCIGARERLVRLQDGRYLVYGLANGVTVRYVMNVGSEQPARISFQPVNSDAADLPLVDRQAIQQSLSDQRVWGADTAQRGIPTSHGVATTSKMMKKSLSPPGDAIRTPQDSRLAQLFEPSSIFDGGSASMARMGRSAVVIKDRRAPPTQIAHYDMQTDTLRQGIEVRGLPTLTGCAVQNTGLEYVFNDDTNALYLMREWTGEVFVIDASFEAKLLTRLPLSKNANAAVCGVTTTGVLRVPLAARTPNGNLVLATHWGVFFKRGERLDRVDAPDQVVQLVVLNDTEALVVAKGGLAKLKLPE